MHTRSKGKLPDGFCSKRFSAPDRAEKKKGLNNSWSGSGSIQCVFLWKMIQHWCVVADFDKAQGYLSIGWERRPCRSHRTSVIRPCERPMTPTKLLFSKIWPAWSSLRQALCLDELFLDLGRIIRRLPETLAHVRTSAFSLSGPSKLPFFAFVVFTRKAFFFFLKFSLQESSGMAFCPSGIWGLVQTVFETGDLDSQKGVSNLEPM